MQAKVQPQRTDGGLTDAQWAGLARLGDLGNRLSPLFDDTFTGPATAALGRLGELDSRHDLATLTEKFVQTVDTLEQAGLLRLLRDNAEFIANTVDVLAPLAVQWLEQLSRLPADELRQDVAFALEALRKTRLLTEFAREHLGEELTARAIEAVRFVQHNQADEALTEMLVQLGRVYRSGMLARLGGLAEYIAGLEEGTDFRHLAGSLVDVVPDEGLEGLGVLTKLLSGIDQAVKKAQQGGDELGGYAGMLHLLRDADVQKGLRVLTLLPTYLERDMS